MVLPVPPRPSLLAGSCTRAAVLTAQQAARSCSSTMPKHGFLTPKAIGNRIKAKGLCKLRWYCEMCVKQCRDENGFKCHQTSEGHLRQMRIFAENPEAVMKEVGGMNRGVLSYRGAIIRQSASVVADVAPQPPRLPIGDSRTLN